MNCLFTTHIQAFGPVGAIFGAPIAGLTADHYGRKNALVLCGVPFFIGYLVLSYAQYLHSVLGFRVLLLVGRFLTGMGMGWAGCIGPVSSYNII